MRKLWIRIGLGAAVVFVSGMFVVTLARQMKNAATSAIRDGGRLSVPLSILPFELDGARVGSVREIDVERNQPGQVKWIRVTVKLKGDAAPDLRDGVITLGHGRSLFDCIPLTEAESRGMVPIGEVLFEPAGLVRPIMLDADHVAEWFDRARGDGLTFRAGAEGANLLVTDGDGRSVVRFQADSLGARLRVRDEKGREVVKLRAGAEGVEVQVQGEAKPPR